MLVEDKTSELTAKHSYGTWRFQKNWKPLTITDAEGCYMYDSKGKKYLDFSSQLVCTNLGHKNRAVIQAIAEQAEKLAYVSPSFATTPRAELNEQLLQVLPRGLSKFFYSPSGTEANEAAIKIARLYTGKFKIIARYRSYHGSTAGSIAATGDPRRIPIERLGGMPGIVFAPDMDLYRSPFGVEFEERAMASVQYIDYIIKNEGNVAAILVEPVVGTNGVIVPPKDYLPALREIASKHGVLLIADEVMSGWGRTGEWFAVDHWKVQPDILTTSKGLTGAYFPLALTATTSEIAEYFDDHYFALGHTYEAHPLGLAAGVAAINEYRRLDLINQAKKRGGYLGKRLLELQEKHASVGDVRGLGLFWAIELVKDRKTKEPFYEAADKLAGKPSPLDQVSSELMRNGLYLMNWLSHFIVAPPLIVTEEQVDEGINALDRALVLADQSVSA